MPPVRSNTNMLSPAAVICWKTYIHAMVFYANGQISNCLALLNGLVSMTETPLYLQVYCHYYIASLLNNVAASFGHIIEAAKTTLLMAELASHDAGVQVFMSKARWAMDFAIQKVKVEIDSVDMSKGIAFALTQPPPSVPPRDIEEMHGLYIQITQQIFAMQGKNPEVVKAASDQAIEAFHFARESVLRQQQIQHAMNIADYPASATMLARNQELPPHEIDILLYVCKSI
jgi:hypothetical protein